MGEEVGGTVGAGVGSDVGAGTGSAVGVGTGSGVGALPSSSSHVQPLQSQPGPLSSWAQVIPLISSQVLLPIHVDGHATDTRTRYHAISQPIFRRRPDIGANLYL